jgi:hypothetical protein
MAQGRKGSLFMQTLHISGFAAAVGVAFAAFAPSAIAQVSIERFGISASCPSGVVTNVPTRFEGTINYNLVNHGENDSVVDILHELVDSAGARRADSETNVLVAAGANSRIEHTLYLTATYDQAGTVTVTVRLSVSGGATFSDSTFCNFVVN